jgi:hypothetical protein
MPLLESKRFALTEWLADVERWLEREGILVSELRELWEEVTPTPPVDPGST